jgi:hypothetical protein
MIYLRGSVELSLRSDVVDAAGTGMRRVMGRCLSVSVFQVGGMAATSARAVEDALH